MKSEKMDKIHVKFHLIEALVKLQGVLKTKESTVHTR